MLKYKIRVDIIEGARTYDMVLVLYNGNSEFRKSFTFQNTQPEFKNAEQFKKNMMYEAFGMAYRQGVEVEI